TDFCIFPPALELPRVGGTKNPAVDAIRALQPDVVYMNLEENLKRHADAIEEFAPVFVTEPKSVDDVAQFIATLGTIHRCDSRSRSNRTSSSCPTSRICSPKTKRRRFASHRTLASSDRSPDISSHGTARERSSGYAFCGVS